MRPTSVFPPVTPPGMAYVPYQQWGKVYDAEEGIDRGTLFPDLDFPFQCAGGDSKR
ncbi:MAG: spore coat associated protein CotJA [Oscillospiraceae bacterium]|nr:spore coat associated protein CotJA [Oscillospiraceae bacterium]